MTDTVLDSLVEDSNAAPPTEEAEVIPPLQVLIGVLVRPRATFERMRDAKSGHWWLVFLIAALATLALAAATLVVSLNAPPTEFTNPSTGAVETIDVPTGAIIIPAIIGGVAGVIGLLLGYAIRAGIVFGTGFAFGGKADFKQIFRMAAWTTLPAAIGSFLSAIAVFATGNQPAAGLSAALTVQEAAQMPFLNALLSNIDVYTIWGAVLLAIGVTVTARLTPIKGIIVSLVYYALVILVNVGIATALGSVTGLATG